jgi:urease subunit alpha
MYHQLNAGVIGFEIHENWGATPKAIETCLAVCEENEADVQLAPHAKTLCAACARAGTRRGCASSVP